MIKPFANDDTAASIGELSIENGTTKVTVSGSLEFTRDKAGLEHARALKRFADELVAALEAQPASPQAPGAPSASVDQVANPFG